MAKTAQEKLDEKAEKQYAKMHVKKIKMKTKAFHTIVWI